MRYKIKQWFAGLLSIVMILSLLPVPAAAESVTPAEETKIGQVQGMIDELSEAEESTADNRAGVQAQTDAVNEAVPGFPEEETAAPDIITLQTLDNPTGDNGTEASAEPVTAEQVQSLIDALPDAESITAENRADVQTQIDAIGAAMLELTGDEAAALDATRYDAAAAAVSALDNQTAAPEPEHSTEHSTEPSTGPSALEQVQALIDALPDAESITAENRADVEAQLAAIDEARQALEDEELDALDITRCMAAVEAILALDDMAGADEPMTMAFPGNLLGGHSGQPVSDFHGGSAGVVSGLY